jgi:hypothetical protein
MNGCWFPFLRHIVVFRALLAKWREDADLKPETDFTLGSSQLNILLEVCLQLEHVVLIDANESAAGLI